MSGNHAGAVTDLDGTPEVMSWQRPTPIRVAITVATTAGLTFPPDGSGRIKEGLLEWWDLNVDLGVTPNVGQLYRPCYEIPGHVVTALTVTRHTNSAALGTANLDEIFTLADADITVTVS